ncbi:MAG: signal peptide peptidase SppA [Sphingomonas sanxanigenens]|uniref:Signal peptide peptidase SppA n=1 Tax=Sphingomonas sanxanigenens TaxID=397260 RepID=A0A2W5A5X6_9SPHN|nr:MAG: signal peptide peptidase SppA [Sphingomonas sanxanigenens]
MGLLRGAWRILVGVKDALVLLFLLLFFGLIYVALSARPMPTRIGDGALLLNLKGSIVEQPTDADLVSSLSSRAPEMREYRLRDVVRALDAAATDARVKAVVLDLDGFQGGGQVALISVGDALGRVRKAGKPVLTYATGYSDAAYLLAANASEIWMNPMGSTAFTGPGGTRLYYKGLIDKLGVTAHIYRVGTYKSAVEPYMRADQSPEAREASKQLAAALWEGWQRHVASARPKAKLAPYIADPAGALAAAHGQMAEAAVASGIVDKLGDRTAFGARVAAIAGGDDSKPAGWYRRIAYDDWVAANPAPGGGQIGVVTVAGEIVDGDADPGTAGGATIARLIHKGIAEKPLKAIVLRVDSPGGSALAAEQIRSALLDAKKKGLPIVVSMGSVAASGGYWVTTVADRIFAEPTTITGSIGVFGILPTAENALAKIGVTSDGVKTTPLSGQPDLFAGTTPEFDKLVQAGVEDIYGRFLTLVSQARHMPLERVNEIAQGRVWDGGTARQIGLVDAFGSIDDAIAEAARRAKIDPATAKPVYLEKPADSWAALARSWTRKKDDDQGSEGDTDLMTQLARQNQALLFGALADAQALLRGPAMQVRCLECANYAVARPVSEKEGETMMQWLLARFAR